MLHRLEGRDAILGGIALAGAVFLVIVAVDCMRASAIDVERAVEAPRSVFKGMLANALNPHPYVGWMTIVGPSMMRAARASPVYAALFLVAFYGTMVTAKMIVAAATERGHDALRGRGHRALMLLLGVTLTGFALKFAADGVALLRSGT